MATAFQGLDYAKTTDTSTRKYHLVNRDEQVVRPRQMQSALESRTLQTITGATILTSNMVGEALVFTGGAAGLTFQLPTAYSILVRMQSVYGGLVATSYGNSVITRTRIENQTAGNISFSTNTGLNISPSPMVIASGGLAYFEWSIASSSPTSPSILVRIISSTPPAVGVLTVQPGTNITVNSTDPSNPIVSLVEYNTRSALDPVFLGANDSITIQNTVNAVKALGTGTVVIPSKPGGTPWNITTPINMIGASYIKIQGNDFPVLTWNSNINVFDFGLSSFCELAGLFFQPAAGFFPTTPAVSALLASTMGISKNRFVASGIRITGANNLISENSFATSDAPAIDCVDTLSYSLISRNIFSSWGNQFRVTPYNISTQTTWTATTPHTQGDIVTSTSGGFTRVYLCSVTGTTGATAPSAQTSAVVDGTVTWIYMERSNVPMISTTGAGNGLNGNTITENSFLYGWLCIQVGGAQWKVINNNFMGFLTAFGPETTLQSSIPSCVWYDILFTGNVISQYLNGVIVTFSATPVTSLTSYWGWNFSGNTFDNGAIGAGSIYIDASTGNGSTSIANIRIDGNTFYSIPANPAMTNHIFCYQDKVLLTHCCGNIFNGKAPAGFCISLTLFGAATGAEKIVCTENITTTASITGISYPAGVANRIVYANNVTI